MKVVAQIMICRGAGYDESLQYQTLVLFINLTCIIFLSNRTLVKRTVRTLTACKNTTPRTIPADRAYQNAHWGEGLACSLRVHPTAVHMVSEHLRYSCVRRALICKRSRFFTGILARFVKVNIEMKQSKYE